MDKNIEHLGNISGKVLLFGGVYSNLQALEALKQVAEDANIAPENCICTGDIIGYCAQPEASVQFFKKWNAKSIAGNVELQLKLGADECGCDFKKGSRCDGFSQQWYPYAQNKISNNSLEFINTLPNHITFNYANKKVMVVHGSYFNTSEFIYKSTPWRIKAENFKITNTDVIFAGHCGLPFKHENNNKLWLNPGVIGMPANNGNPKVWYAILNDDNDALSYNFLNLEYNHNLTHELMLKEPLPKAYAKTLISGIWDNMDILPQEEKQQQGLNITL